MFHFFYTRLLCVFSDTGEGRDAKELRWGDLTALFTWKCSIDTAECVLTQRDRIVNTKTAENLLDVSGMEEAVPFDHHLEGF